MFGVPYHLLKCDNVEWAEVGLVPGCHPLGQLQAVSITAQIPAINGYIIHL